MRGSTPAGGAALESWHIWSKNGFRQDDIFNTDRTVLDAVGHKDSLEVPDCGTAQSMKQHPCCLGSGNLVWSIELLVLFHSFHKGYLWVIGICQGDGAAERVSRGATVPTLLQSNAGKHGSSSVAGLSVIELVIGTLGELDGALGVMHHKAILHRCVGGDSVFGCHIGKAEDIGHGSGVEPYQTVARNGRFVGDAHTSSIGGEVES